MLLMESHETVRHSFLKHKVIPSNRLIYVQNWKNDVETFNQY